MTPVQLLNLINYLLLYLRSVQLHLFNLFILTYGVLLLFLHLLLYLFCG